MKKSVVIILSILLASALIVLLLLYRQYADKSSTLLTCEEQLSELDQTIIQMTRENTDLRGQVLADAEKLENLEKARHRISVLENTAETLGDQAASSNQMVAELQDRIKSFQAFISKRNELIQEKKDNIERLQERVSGVEKKKAAADALIGQLKSDHERAVLKLNQGIQTRDKKIATHLEQIEAAASEGQKIRQEVTANQAEIAGLSSQLSACEEKKAAADERIGQLKSDHDGAVLKFNRQIGVLDNQLETKISQGNDLKEKLKNARDRINLLENQTAGLREQAHLSEAQTVQMKSDHETAVTALNQEIAEKDRSITALEKQLQEIRAEAIALTDETKAHEGRIKYLEERISKLFGEKELLKSHMGQLKSSYTAMTSELKNQILKKEVTIDELEGKLRITFVNRILFEFGKAAISSQGKDILTKVGKTLKEFRDKKIRVIGHTDSIPIMEKYRYKFPSNWELSAARSASVVRFLQTKIGIDPRNLEAVGRALYDPIAPNTTEAGRTKNRRVNIIVAPLIE